MFKPAKKKGNTDTTLYYKFKAIYHFLQLFFYFLSKKDDFWCIFGCLAPKNTPFFNFFCA